MGSELIGEGGPEWKGNMDHKDSLSQRENEGVAREICNWSSQRRWDDHTGDH